MKEFQQQVKPLYAKEIAAEERTKKTSYIGKFRVHKGQSVFKLDTTTGSVMNTDDSDYKVKLIKSKVTGKAITRRELHIKGDRYQYIIALNKKNAARKFRQKGFKVESIS